MVPPARGEVEDGPSTVFLKYRFKVHPRQRVGQGIFGKDNAVGRRTDQRVEVVRPEEVDGGAVGEGEGHFVVAGTGDDGVGEGFDHPAFARMRVDGLPNGPAHLHGLGQQVPVRRGLLHRGAGEVAQGVVVLPRAAVPEQNGTAPYVLHVAPHGDLIVPGPPIVRKRDLHPPTPRSPGVCARSARRRPAARPRRGCPTPCVRPPDGS